MKKWQVELDKIWENMANDQRPHYDESNVFEREWAKKEDSAARQGLVENAKI